MFFKTKSFLSIFVIISFYSSIFSQNVDWAFGAGDWVNDLGMDVITDSEGFIYITGEVPNMGAQFGTFTMPAGGAFLVKMNQDGEVVWAKFGDGQEMKGVDIAIDNDDNVILFGTMSSNSTFDGHELQGGINESVFLVKLSKDGNVLFAKSFYTTSIIKRVIAGGVGVDTQNNIYLTGHYNGELNFNNSTLPPPNQENDYNIFLIKLNSIGLSFWGKSFGNNNDDHAFDLEIDSENNIIIGGDFIPIDIDFGNFTYDLNLSRRLAFIAKFDKDGQNVWVNSAAGFYNSGSRLSSLALDSENNVYWVGDYLGIIYFSEELRFNGSDDNMKSFLVKTNAGGYTEWAKSIDTSVEALNDRQTGVNVDSDGNVFFTSHFSGELEIGSLNLQSIENSKDALFVKFDNSGNPIWMINGGSTSDDYGKRIAIDNDNQLYLIGSYRGGTGTFGDQTITNNSGNDNLDVFLVKVSN